MKTTRFLVTAALIGALYAVLTLAILPLAFGTVQFRVSEALTVLPMFTPAAIPGLTVGCFIANLMSGYGIPDQVFGTLATLLASLGSYLLRRHKWLVPLPPVLFNAVFVGSLIYVASPNEGALWFNMLTIGLGELGACYVLGMPLIFLFEKHPRMLGGGLPR